MTSLFEVGASNDKYYFSWSGNTDYDNLTCTDEDPNWGH